MIKLCSQAFAVALLGIPLQAFAQEKKEASPPALPSDVADWTIVQLLERYDAGESDNRVGRELDKRGKGKRFIVFKTDRSVDVKASEFLYKELRKGFDERQWYEVDGVLAKTYKVGHEPEDLFDENPLFPGQVLRLDGSCQKTNRKWAGVPLFARQVLYLAITDSKELTIDKLSDAHDVHDRLKGKDAKDLNEWLKERYPAAYVSYESKKGQNQLPVLKISSDKLKGAGAWEHLDLTNARPMDGFFRIPPKTGIKTKDSYKGPIEITVVGRTEFNNLRVAAYKGAMIIFNWELNRKKLAVHHPDGKAGKLGSVTHHPFQPLEANTWYTLRWRITNHGMEVAVNGRRVFSEKGKYALVEAAPIQVRALDSTVDVKLLEVKQL